MSINLLRQSTKNSYGSLKSGKLYDVWCSELEQVYDFPPQSRVESCTMTYPYRSLGRHVLFIVFLTLMTGHLQRLCLPLPFLRLVQFTHHSSLDGNRQRILLINRLVPNK